MQAASDEDQGCRSSAPDPQELRRSTPHLQAARNTRLQRSTGVVNHKTTGGPRMHSGTWPLSVRSAKLP
eukprot:15463558-Alexandrium_andersonii.AAC.1